jgi:hypothetical protein
VRRHKLVPPHLRQLERSGFGVRFLLPGELVSELLPQAQDGTLEVSIDSVAQLRQAIEQEIRYGGVFVRSNRKLARDTPVTVAFLLEFAGRRIEFPARVVQVMSATVEGLWRLVRVGHRIDA